MGNSPKERRKIFKYNEDDILEILTEYLGEENGFGTFNSRAMIVGTPGKDLRLIAVIGELDDEEINTIDLQEIDEKNVFNGSHR